MSDEILAVQEVAALLKVADKTAYTMAQKREIPVFKARPVAVSSLGHRLLEPGADDFQPRRWGPLE